MDASGAKGNLFRGCADHVSHGACLCPATPFETGEISRGIKDEKKIREALTAEGVGFTMGQGLLSHPNPMRRLYGC